MSIEIIYDDITTMDVEGIVNAANTLLLGGGGVDGAIHRGAGPELLADCRKLGGCKVGQAKITKAYRLPAKYIIHTVGPVWHDGKRNEKKKLEACYQNSLALAKENKIQSIAFPLVSSGAFGYPKALAMEIAVTIINNFLINEEMQVSLVVYDQETLKLAYELFPLLVRKSY